MLAKLIAVVIHEIREELRKLDPPQAEPQDAPADPHRYDPASTTSAVTERASAWDHDKTPPVTAFGFGRQT
jgi:hypothetical protein